MALRAIHDSPSPNSQPGYEVRRANQRTNSIHKVDARRVRALTDTYVDGKGRRVKLWVDEKYRLVGTVLTPESKLTVVGGAHVHNGLNADEAGATLLSRLRAQPTGSWDLVFNEVSGQIHVWPKLRAAAVLDKYTVATKLNPFADKTADQCAEMLRSKGYTLSNVKANGGQEWRNPSTGRIAYIDPGQHEPGHKSYEGPHIDMEYLGPKLESGEHQGYIKQVIKLYNGKGEPLMKNGEHLTRAREIRKKKFPLRPSDTNWPKMINVAKQSWVQHERSCGREASWNALPTMQKGGVEFTLKSLKNLNIEPAMTFFVPVGVGCEKSDAEEINRLIRELFIGIYVCHESPSLAMDPQDDGPVHISLPPSYQGTLVGDVLKEVDALGKGVMQGVIFPERARRDFMASWEAGGLSDVLKGDIPAIGYEKTLAIYLQHGARLLDRRHLSALEETGRDLRELMKLVQIPSMNYTFIPRQRSLRQDGPNVILDSELVVRGDFVLGQGAEDLRETVDEAFRKSADGIGQILCTLPEAERPLRLLKVVGFFSQLLVTLKEQGLMPELNALPAAPIGFAHEDEMPPFLKARSSFDPTWYLHGGAEIDFSTVPQGQMSERTKECLTWARPGEPVSIVSDTGNDVASDFLALPISVVKFDEKAREPQWMFDLLKGVAGTDAFFALQTAARMGDIGGIERLQKEVNEGSWSGRIAGWPFKKLINESNALAHAVARNQFEAVERLTELGANVNARFADGLNIALALAEDKLWIKAFLESKGAKHGKLVDTPRGTVSPLSTGLTVGYCTALVASAALPVLLPVGFSFGVGAAIWGAVIVCGAVGGVVGADALNTRRETQRQAFDERLRKEREQQF